jgi:cell fate regulator YaaT (PSP1 superfamily)
MRRVQPDVTGCGLAGFGRRGKLTTTDARLSTVCKAWSWTRIGASDSTLRIRQLENEMPKYVVRYGAMRMLGVVTARGNTTYVRGTDVIVRTNRGLEIGQVLCEAPAPASPSLEELQHGQILRAMTPEDANELAHILASAREEFTLCQRHVEELGLDMQLVDIEHLFGGERIIIYYLAEGRVDFRELVKLLAGEFQTRIEMRQIGVRDEAKLLADYGDCGKQVCCNTHLIEMPPVSMKMAKLQKATLDPTKISGRCGRLKCCLRYEYDVYVELQKELPPVGSEIVTANGKARVLNQEILARQLLVEMEDSRRVLVDAADVLSVTRRGKAPRAEE